MTFATKVKQLPIGASEVIYKKKKYLLTKEEMFGGKIIKVYAKSLSGKDFISFNYYITQKGEGLKPCEMSEKKVTEFILAI